MDPTIHIRQLLNGIESYNPEHRILLEQHLDWQISTGEYDLEANLALLRLYQFYPEHFNVDATKLVLLKALASFSPSDFILYKYLIQLDHLSEEPLSVVTELGMLLEACQFPRFWMCLRENPNITAGLPSFRDCIIKFIVQVVANTYQRIPKALLGQFLDMSGSELNQLIQSHGWTECSNPEDPQAGALILVKKHEENVKSVKIQERVNFDSITSMSGAFRPSKGEFFIKTGP